jgi:hypothetical protein
MARGHRLISLRAAVGGMTIGKGNASIRRKSTARPLSPLKNSTRGDLETNPDRRDGKSATSRLMRNGAVEALCYKPEGHGFDTLKQK